MIEEFPEALDVVSVLRHVRGCGGGSGDRLPLQELLQEYRVRADRAFWPCQSM
jgi:hypothetical protein